MCNARRQMRRLPSNPMPGAGAYPLYSDSPRHARAANLTLHPPVVGLIPGRSIAKKVQRCQSAPRVQPPGARLTRRWPTRLGSASAPGHVALRSPEPSVAPRRFAECTMRLAERTFGLPARHANIVVISSHRLFNWIASRVARTPLVPRGRHLRGLP